MNNPSSRPVSPRPSMAQATLAKKKKKPRRWPYVLLSLAALCVLAVLILPRLLVQQATQKPAETGTFITQQVQTTTLQDKMQQALIAGGNGSQGTAAQPNQANQGQLTQPGQPTQNQSGSQSGQNTTTQFDSQVMSNINTDSSAGQNNTQSPNQTSSQTNPQNQSASQPNVQNQTAGQNNSVDAGRQSQPVQNTQPAQPPANDGRFRVQMSASEISGMINSGLVQGTAPEYRASIQGVSTTIQGGRARITVALLPRHLPDAFLSNLPGVTRDTPTVYLGGEMSLSVSGNTITPTIHQLSLGNFRVPMPFIQSAVAQTVRQQADQLLRLPNGQRASLDDVILDQGAVTLVGHVQ